jgi:hypothetical protein
MTFGLTEVAQVDPYGYTAGDPVNASDPSGHDAVFDYGSAIEEGVIEEEAITAGEERLAVNFGNKWVIFWQLVGWLNQQEAHRSL